MLPLIMLRGSALLLRFLPAFLRALIPEFMASRRRTDGNCSASLRPAFSRKTLLRLLLVSTIFRVEKGGHRANEHLEQLVHPATEQPRLGLLRGLRPTRFAGFVCGLLSHGQRTTEKSYRSWFWSFSAADAVSARSPAAFQASCSLCPSW